MSTSTETSPAVEHAKQHTTMCRDRLLRTFSFVPDGKLTWSPSPTCKHALRIAAHSAVSNGVFVNIIKGIPFPDVPREEMFKMAEASETAITTREAAVQAIEESCTAVLEALDGLTPEQIEATIETPVFTAPMMFWMHLPGRHMDNHAAQIDLLQTCWGDMDWHM